MKLGEKVYTYNVIKKSLLESTPEVRIGHIVSIKKRLLNETEYVVKTDKGLKVHTKDTVYKYHE